MGEHARREAPGTGGTTGRPPAGSGSRRVVVLGSTGSIGRQALEVIVATPGLEVAALVARTAVDATLELAGRLHVPLVGLHEPSAAAAAAARRPACRVFAGEDGIAEIVATVAREAREAGDDVVVLNGIVGAAGLRATVTTLAAGVTLALANKESMVAGGDFVLDAARESGARIIPVDSEHSAIFQCLAAGGVGSDGLYRKASEDTEGPQGPVVEEILLTGSGGPFRGWSVRELEGATPAQALRHPNWVMGAKVTIDSATLMNKGLELLEAHYLFGIPYERLSVVIHPQSLVHSMVRFADGAVFAHLGVPDMRVPIGYALTYPARPSLEMVERLSFAGRSLTFEEPDPATFRCLALARAAGERAARASAGAAPRRIAAPAVLNAANEVAVAAFLEGRLSLPGIAAVVEKTLGDLGDHAVGSLGEVMAMDAEARRCAGDAVSSVH